MPMPPEYRRASAHFEAFILDARDTANLETTHQAYTMVQAVLQTFRRRLSIEDAIRFAGVLPPVLRAIFVADWDTSETTRPFESREAMNREVQALRADHNYAPDTAIRDVAATLRRHMDHAVLERVLDELPVGAAGFWDP